MHASPLSRPFLPLVSGRGVGAALAALVLAAFASADELHLTNGDRISGAVVERTAEKVVVENPVLGRLEIPVSEVVELTGADGAPVDLAAPPPDAPPPDAPPPDAPPPDAPPPAPEKEWKNNFEFGGGGSFGNTDTQNFFVAMTNKREGERDRTSVETFYYFGQSDGDRTENRFYTLVLQDWLVPETPWLYFALARFDYDEFQSWEYRIQAHGGVGYELFKEENFDLTLRGGGGATKQFNSDRDDVQWEALAGLNYRWQITERQTLEGAAVLYPSLSDVGEFRTSSFAQWAVKVDDESNMSITARLEHEYQSQVDPGFDRNDLRLVAGLKFDF